MITSMGIGAFGKQKKQAKPPTTTFDDVRAAPRYGDASSSSIGPSGAVPPKPRTQHTPLAHQKGPQPDFIEENDSDDEEQDDQDDEESPLFPTTHEAVLKEHKKVVSALAIDPSGARFASGSHDYDCKLWDFGGMGGGVGRPFKSFEPAENYYVNDLKYSIAGDQLLVISGTAQAKIYDRDGEEIQTCIKGDPYIRDMKNTAGHVGELSGGAWHPKDPQTFITSSADSTIRIWDVENKRKQKTVIVVKSKERGARTKITSCAYSHDGSYIAAACYDGAIHLWSTTSNFVRPNMSVEGAHAQNTETGSVMLSIDGRTLLSRGGDDTVKTWDIRSFKKPLYTAGGLTNLYPGMNAIWSPDEKYVVVGSGTPPKGGKAAGGKLSFLKREGLTVADEIEMTSCIVKILWHSKINQIFTTHADGSIHILYSPHTSINGVKLLNRQRDKRAVTIEDASAALLTAPILTPGDGFRDDDISAFMPSSKRKREKERMDPKKSMRPDLPVSGPGRGGRVGASATQHIVQNLVRDTMREEDPREALLRIGQKVDSDPQWTKAWTATQPKPVFQEMEEEKEESD
ncbi:transcription factor [Serendipita vermifera]|nr:transcription factor [Serendipita vermifera]